MSLSKGGRVGRCVTEVRREEVMERSAQLRDGAEVTRERTVLMTSVVALCVGGGDDSISCNYKWKIIASKLCK